MLDGHFSDSLDEPLDVIINITPKQVLLKILAGDSPTIQAALDTLLMLLSLPDRKDDFVNLVEITWHLHPERTLPISCLECAAEFDSVDSCRTLLQMIRWPKGDQSDSGSSEFYYYSQTVLASIGSGHITDCAKILFQHLFEPSTTVLLPEGSLANRIFGDFLQSVAEGRNVGSGYDKNIYIGIENPAVLPMLDWLFKIGANVDLQAEKRPLDEEYTFYTPKDWMPTIIDDVYFLNSKLFFQPIGHSTKSKTELTRPGIHHSASRGIDSLHMYLLSQPSHTPAEQDMLVDIHLVEEFPRPEDSDFKALRTLLDYNCSFRKLDLNTSTMLYHVIRKARKQGMHPAVYHRIKTLMQGGATIVAETMERAVEDDGTTLLQLLLSYGAEFKSQGVLALCEAARIGNYDAVNWLIDTGIDTDATLHSGWTILAYGNMERSQYNIQVLDHRWHRRDYHTEPMGCEMLKYLICRKFNLRAKHGDTSARQLLCLILRCQPFFFVLGKVWEKVQLILDAEPWMNDQPNVDQCPLEAFFGNGVAPYQSSGKLALMNLLLERGISARNSGVLAHLFRHNASDTEIQKALDSGASVDTWQRTPIQAAADNGPFDWVQYLIQKGADVNKPAKGEKGRTALQAACDTEPPSRNIELVKLLIAAGADANAPPAPNKGMTAFQGASTRGDFEMALLLLENGADINAPPAEKKGLCALYGAVRYQRLDMVQFLLDLGALSHNMGESGYRGAIRIAQEDGNQAIADLIRRHALKNGKSGEELSSDWDYSIPFEPISLDKGSDLEIWNQTSWEDWLQF
ncbi:hypothetical protein EKO27_g6150 [Xylaria grammica]|uniref:Uncharacterized protein n=1 Tax=Xylaria grammica TaxID=363999 RepID=A0A439D3I6_9PEZI|nr:hypothetical protein EKO27_g6150 [Xylaria grammica]